MCIERCVIHSSLDSGVLGGADWHAMLGCLLTVDSRHTCYTIIPYRRVERFLLHDRPLCWRCILF